MFLRAPYLLRLEALWQLELEGVVLVVLLVVAALLELAPEHVARRENATALRHYHREVLAAADVYHLVALLVTEVSVVDLMEFVVARGPTAAEAKHVLATLTMPEQLSLFG